MQDSSVKEHNDYFGKLLSFWYLLVRFFCEILVRLEDPTVRHDELLVCDR